MQAVVLAENLRQLIGELGPRSPEPVRMAYCEARVHALKVVDLVAEIGVAQRDWCEGLRPGADG